MKKLMRRISQNKFQFFFFVGVLAFVLLALIIATTTTKDKPVDVPNEVVKPSDPVTEPVITDVEEQLALPFDSNMDYQVVRKFYEKDGSKKDQEKALIQYGTTFRTSDGTGFSRKDNSAFDVLAVLSGKVVEIKEHPLYSNYVVVEHENKTKSYYYGLSEVSVTIGSNVDQGTKLGVSGTTEIDHEAGNHVFVKFEKAGKKENIEKLVGKKISEIA